MYEIKTSVPAESDNFIDQTFKLGDSFVFSMFKQEKCKDHV